MIIRSRLQHQSMLNQLQLGQHDHSFGVQSCQTNMMYRFMSKCMPKSRQIKCPKRKVLKNWIQSKYFSCILTTDGCPERKQSSLHSGIFFPTPKLLGTAKAYFVCYIRPTFQISLIYAFMGCPQSMILKKEIICQFLIFILFANLASKQIVPTWLLSFQWSQNKNSENFVIKLFVSFHD